METPQRSSVVTCVIPFDSVQWSRDHLMAGCVCFPVFVFLAWLCAVVNDHHLYSTLSEMVYDWSTAEGKVFIPALLLPAIFFLISSYPYRLGNARADTGPNDHFFVVLRHFVLNTGLILIAFVPTIPLIQSDAHLIQTILHGIAATVAFLAYAASETQVVCCNPRLFSDERKWRRRALAVTVACLILCGLHKLSFGFLEMFAKYSEAWTFRYEMLLGAGVMSGNLMVWTWSNPLLDDKKEDQGITPFFATIPYLGVIGIIITDFFSRDNRYGGPFLLIELAVLIGVVFATIILIESLGKRWEEQQKTLADAAHAPPSYGAA